MTQSIKSKAAIAWGPGQPLSIEEIDVMAPQKGEVRVRIVASGVCHTDAFTLLVAVLLSAQCSFHSLQL